MAVTPAQAAQARLAVIEKRCDALLSNPDTARDAKGRIHIRQSALPSVTLSTLQSLYGEFWHVEEVHPEGEAVTFAFSPKAHSRA